MQTIRIGNDITIRATVTRQGEAEDLTGKTLKLILRSSYELLELPFTVSGNVLTAIWYGSQQTKTGRYTLTLTETSADGSGSKFTTDERGVLELVPTACQSCGTSATALTGAQTLDIDLNVTLPANGLSAYEIALRHGFEGTEQEWLDSVEGNAAAVAALQDGIDANATDIASLLASVTALQEAPETETIEGQEVKRYCGGCVWVMQNAYALSSEFEDWAKQEAVYSRPDCRIVLALQESDNNRQSSILLNTYFNTAKSARQQYIHGMRVYHRVVGSTETDVWVRDGSWTFGWSGSTLLVSNSAGEIIHKIDFSPIVTDTTEMEAGIAASTAATEANAAAISANADSLAALEERVAALEEEADTGRTVGEMKCNVYMGGAVIDLGTVAASSVGENWCGRADVCASGARILLYDVDNETTASTQSAIVTNTYNSRTDTALQVLHLGAKAYHRTVTGIQAATDSGYHGDTEKGSWTEIEL